jgi:hypothetical protein
LKNSPDERFDTRAMSAARIIYPPMSGRDRRHFAAEIRKGEEVFRRATADAEAAHDAADRALANAHRLDSALQFIGGPEDPSPSIANAIHGGCELLEVQCRHCNHAELINLTEVIRPREKPVHTLRGVLYCRPCELQTGNKRRPNLAGLRARENPEPAAPARAERKP